MTYSRSQAEMHVKLCILFLKRKWCSGWALNSGKYFVFSSVEERLNLNREDAASNLHYFKIKRKDSSCSESKSRLTLQYFGIMKDMETRKVEMFNVDTGVIA